ncbi:MAG: hypothetical protein V8T31_00170 [Lachnospiraceae bacterium]
MEAVQVQDAVEEIWGVSDQELGITRPDGYSAEPTRVIYLGQKWISDDRKRYGSVWHHLKI